MRTAAKIWIAFAVMLFLLMTLPGKSFALDYEDYPVVKLRSLDKITARTMTFEVKVGSTVRFGEIFIKVQACRKPPPVEKSEAAAFLQIWQSKDEAQAAENSKWIFSGWMFASSPALSSMDHPVYDVWVLDCLGRDPEQLPSSPPTATPPPPTDGAAPNAKPPAIEPDKAAKFKDTGGVSKEDDPGAFDDEESAPGATGLPANASSPASPDGNAASEEESVPATNMPASAVPKPQSAYTPPAPSSEDYKDETPPDDTSPKDDTVPASQPGRQDIQGIY